MAAVSVGRAASLAVSSATLTVVRTCELTGYPSTTPIRADATVRQDRSTTNYGTSTTLAVRSSSGANRRAFLRYDLTQCTPAIPATASVKRATLSLSVTATGLPATCRTEDVFRVTGSWSESTITWANQPSSSASPTSSAVVGALLGCTNGTPLAYVGWDVTADVQAFADGTATNNGWVVRDRTEGAAVVQAAVFASRNNGVAAAAPLLTVTYMT
jgi:hypothetical protein